MILSVKIIDFITAVWFICR